jgi:L-lactate dehydrogenase complex protein LldG
VSDARAEILARVRAARADAAGAAPAPRAYRQSDGRQHAELVSLFCERAGDYRAEVERVSTDGQAGADGLAGAIHAAATRHGARRLVVPPELPNRWRPDGLELIADSGLTPRELDRLDGVITGCTVAIAETGTIVLSAGPHEGRRALTLVPDVHICVVGEDQIVGSVPEGLARAAAVVREQRRPLTLISGPSATSDIELQRVEGVHGPRRLVVLVIAAVGPARS